MADAPPLADYEVPASIRRRFALRARSYFLVGVAMRGLYGAALLPVLVVLVARIETYIAGTAVDDSTLWSLTGWASIILASIGFVVAGAASWVVASHGVARYLLLGIPRRPAEDGELAKTRDAIARLAPLCGGEEPELWIIDDPVPNGISAPSRDARRVYVTAGIERLEQDQVDAVLAHLMVRLAMPEARTVRVAVKAMVTARNTGYLAFALGALALIGAGFAASRDFVEPTLFVAGGVLIGAALVPIVLTSAPLRAMRRDWILLADEGALLLLDRPVALAVVLEELERLDGRVLTTTDRAELLWFEAAELVVPDTAHPGGARGQPDSGASKASHSELAERAKRVRALVAAGAAGGVGEDSMPAWSPSGDED